MGNKIMYCFLCVFRWRRWRSRWMRRRLRPLIPLQILRPKQKYLLFSVTEGKSWIFLKVKKVRMIRHPRVFESPRQPLMINWSAFCVKLLLLIIRLPVISWEGCTWRPHVNGLFSNTHWTPAVVHHQIAHLSWRHTRYNSRRSEKQRNIFQRTLHVIL